VRYSVIIFVLTIGNLMIQLNLEIAEVNTVLAGLNKLTMEQAMPTWQKIVAQAQPQAQAQPADTGPMEPTVSDVSQKA